MLATARPASLVIVIDDPTRPESGAVTLARAIVAGTGVALDVVRLPSDGDRRALIVERVVRRDGDLVVLDAHGGGFAGDRLLDEDAEVVLEGAWMPVLARGPAAPAPTAPRTVVVGLDGSADVAAALDVAATWQASFGPVAVVVAALQAPTSWPRTHAPTADRVLAGALRERALEAVVEPVDATEPWRDLAAAATRHPDAIVVVTARRWHGRDHWFSTARRLIRHAACPVLVVPAGAARDEHRG